MPDPVDLDQLVKDASDTYAQSPEGLRSKTTRALSSAPIYPIQQPPKKEGIVSRALHGSFLPGSLSELNQAINPIEHWKRFGTAWHNITQGNITPSNALDTLASAWPAPIFTAPQAALSMGKQIFDPIGQSADQAIQAYKSGDYEAMNRHIAAVGAAPFTVGASAMMDQGDIAGGIGRIAGTVGAPILPKAIRSVVPEQMKFDLINKALGEGAIETKYGKDVGRGVARAKVGALTRGQVAQPSAGITKSKGLPKGVDLGLNEATSAKEQLLQHPNAQAQTIPIKDIIEDNFGPITPSPVSGQPEVVAKTATNIPENTQLQLSGFGTNLLNELLKRANPKNLSVSAADIEQMRKEKIIDPNYGAFSTDAPEASLNQKAVKVSSDLTKRAEDALRLPSGESALELLNSQISDLMQGKQVIPEKLAASRTSGVSFPRKIGAKIGEFFTPSFQLGGGKPAGFGTGRIGMPIRTGLASWLTEKPWWLQDPTRGLTTPPPEFGVGVPEDPFGAGGGPQGLSPHPPAGLLGPGPSTLQGAPGGSQTGFGEPPGGQVPPTPGAAPEASGAAGIPPQLNFPPQPTHITEGKPVSGFDPAGNLVSGNLEKLFATVEGGKPLWKALVLDLKKGKTVELPADQVFDKLAGPPGTTKATGTAKVPGSETSYRDIAKKGPELPKGTNRVVEKPPGTEPAGIAGGPPVGPDQPFENTPEHQFAHVRAARAYKNARELGKTPEEAQEWYNAAYNNALKEFNNPNNPIDANSINSAEVEPREKGGIYWSSYWNKAYEVLDISKHPDGQLKEVRVRWLDDNRATSHATPWEPGQDKIIKPGENNPSSLDIDLIKKLSSKMEPKEAARVMGIIRGRQQTLGPYESQAVGQQWDRLMSDPEAYNEFFQGPMTGARYKYK